MRASYSIRVRGYPLNGIFGPTTQQIDRLTVRQPVTWINVWFDDDVLLLDRTTQQFQITGLRATPTIKPDFS